VSPHRLALLILAASGFLAGGPARAEPPLGATVEGLLAYARERNPEYAAMREEATAAQEKVYPAGAFPDPMFKVELQNVTNYGSDAAPSLNPAKVGSTKYTLSQSLPFFGKRDLRREAAEADAEQAQGRAAATWAELSARIKSSYAQYYLVARNEQLTRENIELMMQLDRVAQTRYANGLVPQQDAIRAQIELTGMRVDLLGIQSETRQWQSRLNALLSRNAAAPLTTPERLRPIPAPAKLDQAALEDRVRARNPVLFADAARVRAAEKYRDLADRNGYPDVLVGVSPIQMGSRVNMWELMLEVSIPLQRSTLRAQKGEADAMLAAARSRQQATANQLLSELSENLAGLEAARQIDVLAESSLLPQANLTLQAALAGYENGKVDFATLLDAQRQIRRAKLDRYKARAEAEMRLAEIERVLGEDL
jgi:outer membrane protein, heavy metal efflux system